jgi:hypothetical protein
LLHRLNVIRIEVPPLRARRDDIPELLHFYLSTAATELGVEAKVLTKEAETALVAYDWPGTYGSWSPADDSQLRHLAVRSRWRTFPPTWAVRLLRAVCRKNGQDSSPHGLRSAWPPVVRPCLTTLCLNSNGP